MEEQGGDVDDLKTRRYYFQKNYPIINIALERLDINSHEVLKNTCPNCGYLTLCERASFDICGICFWEDDGSDDFEEDNESGPNQMSLKEGRMIFHDAKLKLMNTKHDTRPLFTPLRNYFFELDILIQQESVNKYEIIKLHNIILDILEEHRVYGLEQLFNTTH